VLASPLGLRPGRHCSRSGAELWLEVIEVQAGQGFDYVPIHVDVRRGHLPLPSALSPGSALVAPGCLRWMVRHKRKNPLHEAIQRGDRGSSRARALDRRSLPCS
jgi:thiamine biosynthesis protein ThiC